MQITGTANPDQLNGTSADDFIDGGARGDTLHGGGGNDSMMGGDGDDVLFGDEGSDVFYIATNDGNDRLYADAQDTIYLLYHPSSIPMRAAFGPNGEETVILSFMQSAQTITLEQVSQWRSGLKLRFSDDQAITGAELLQMARTLPVGTGQNDQLVGTYTDDTLAGLAGDDTLDGGTGADTLTGGAGNDVYLVERDGDQVIEMASEGFDAVISTVPYVLGPHVEKLILSGGLLTGDGNELDNVLIGNSSAHSFIATGSMRGQVYGYERYYGSVLRGGAGQDTLISGYGNDALFGGAGNDVYDLSTRNGVYEWWDEVTEVQGEGIDEVRLVEGYGQYKLVPQVENLTVATTNGGNAVGNELANVIKGSIGADILAGGVGDDTLSGAKGDDHLTGDDGADTYLIARGDGVDTIDADAHDRIVFAADILASDIVFGKTSVLGADALLLGFKGEPGSLLLPGMDQWGDGPTLVWGDGSTLSGAALRAMASPAVRQGTAGNDELRTFSDQDTLQGLGGDDTLTGGSGPARLLGGTGNDVYLVNHPDQVVVELAGQGLDTVMSTVDYTLPPNAEALTLLPAFAQTLAGYGNQLDNVMRVSGPNAYGTGRGWLDGGAGQDTLYGADDDTLLGGDGNDVIIAGRSNELTGGAGADLYKVQAKDYSTIHADSLDTIEVEGAILARLSVSSVGEYNPNTVKVSFGDYYSAVDLDAAGSWNGLTMKLDGIQITGAQIMDMAKGGPLIVSGSAGNDLLTGTSRGDSISGLAGDDTLDGRAGIDTLIGGAGHDTYLMNYEADVIVEEANAGTDTMISYVSQTLPANVERLLLQGVASQGQGNALDNLIDADAVVSGKGAQLNGMAGRDTLFGTVWGDTLSGGAGNDVLTGGEGVDLYLFNVGDDEDLIHPSAQDIIRLGTGIERFTHRVVRHDPTANLVTATLGKDVLRVDNISALGELTLQFADGSTMSGAEWVALADQAGGQLIQGTDSADVLEDGYGDDTLHAGGGDDLVHGSVGADVLTGGLGNDTLAGGADANTYVFQRGDGRDLIHADALDVIALGAGILRTDLSIGKLGAAGAGAVVLALGVSDAITLDNAGQWDGLQLSFADGSSLSGKDIMLEASKPVEPPKPVNLTLNGTASKDTLTGKAGNDTLSGLSGNDTLAGGTGNDKLIGGKGADTYLFNRGDGQDTIVENDTSLLSNLLNPDLLKVGSAKSNQLWLTKAGNNLDIAIIGTKDKVTIQDWYKGSANQVEKITALGDNKSLSASKVNALVNAMAKFSAPAEGVTTLPAATQTALTKVLASSWA